MATITTHPFRIALKVQTIGCPVTRQDPSHVEPAAHRRRSNSRVLPGRAIRCTTLHAARVEHPPAGKQRNTEEHLMKTPRNVVLVAGLLTLGLGAQSAAAQDQHSQAVQVSVSGGFHTLNKNDTALPDQFTDFPLAAAV